MEQILSIPTASGNTVAIYYLLCCFSYHSLNSVNWWLECHQFSNICTYNLNNKSHEPTHLMHHLADNFNQNPRNFWWRNTFYGMGIICSVIPAVSSFFTIPHSEDVSTEDVIRITEIERKSLPSSRRPLRLNLIEFNKPVIPLAYLDSHMGC